MQLWTPNQQLQNGKFTIQKVLGGGGYGVTYGAIDRSTNKTVAIKTLNPIHHSQADFEQQQIKFVQEAFRLKGCSHPHIVKIHEVINENGLWGMVMEYIQGQDLAVYISQNGKLSEPQALGYINQIGTALEYIHQQGMLHRDVKPNNIMLRENKQEAVLIDFGLAREFDLNQTGSMTNSKTEGYAPIEQYERRGKFAPYTDVYALAATLYHLVTGEPPFPAEFRKYAELPAPKQRNPEIGDRLNDGIMKGMALEPENRPQTVKEWLDLLIPKSSQSKSSQVKPIPQKKSAIPKKPSEFYNNNILEKIQLEKFEFEYAKIEQKKVFDNRLLGFGRKVDIEIKRYCAQAESFTEDLGNGVTLEMVKIPGGSFTMGSPEHEKESRDNERPQHQVNIQPFFMGKFQITQEQYQAITGKNPSPFQGKNRPVEKVNWYDAVEFCKKLSKLTGKEYRLASEAEWEYACRAGTTTPFHFGETITTDLANYRGNYTYGAAPRGFYRRETTNVGSFPANPFGLYDMHGNVWEWCLDDRHHNYKGAPKDGSAWFDENNNLSQKQDRAVLRGGSWLDAPGFCRSASRVNHDRAERGYFYGSIGFRVVCAVGRA